MLENDGLVGNFNKLCLLYAHKTANHKRSIVIGNNLAKRKLRRLNKRLYTTLFESLYSPYMGTPKVYSTPVEDPYAAITALYLDAQVASGHEITATETLYSNLDLLQSLNNDVIDSVLVLLFKMADVSCEKQDSLKKQSFDEEIEERYFQFDSRALQIGERKLEHFGGNVGDFSFDVPSSEMFSLKPGTFFQGNTSNFIKERKESTMDVDTRKSLFGALVNKNNSSLDEVLRIPDLPNDPRDVKTPFYTKRFENSKNESIDEGFVEDSTFSTSTFSTSSDLALSFEDLKLWDQAADEENKVLPAWEDITSDDQPSTRYLSELGRCGFDCIYNLQLASLSRVLGAPVKISVVADAQLYRDSLHALIGITSQSYAFVAATCSLVPVSNLRCSGLSAESVRGTMESFAGAGTCYRRLRKFCRHHHPSLGVSGGLVLKAFVTAVNDILYSYWSAIFLVEGMESLTLNELWRMFRKFSFQLSFLSDICLCSEAFKRSVKKHAKPKFPVGASLLTYLYNLCVNNASTEHFQVLLYLFKRVSVPYVSFIKNWLFEGVCNDPYNEFFVKVDHSSLCYRDKHYWTQGFQMKQTRESIPLFLDTLADSIFACGKSINLIKLVNIKHFLLDSSVKPPNIGLTFSAEKLDGLEEECQKYIRSAKKSEEKAKTKKEKEKLSEEFEWKERLNKEKKITHDALQHIKDMERKVREAIQNKKKGEFEELRKQFLDSVEKRAQQKEEKLVEDRKWREEINKHQEKEDEVKKKAREELIEFYEELSWHADQREFRARWTIRRMELHEKRVFFIQEEENKLLQENGRVEDLSKNNSGNVNKNQIGDDGDNNLKQINDLGKVQIDDSGEDVVSQNKNEDLLSLNQDGDLVNLKQGNISNIDTDSTDKAQSLTVDTVDAASGFDDLKLSTRGGFVRSYSEDAGNEAKNLLYPPLVKYVKTTKVSLSPAVTSHPTEGDETKHLLYPLGDDGSMPMSKTKKHLPIKGNDTKRLLYPSDELTQPDIIRKHNIVEGDSTKSLLYPTDRSSDLAQPDIIRKHTIHEGNSTKSLIYPTDRSSDLAQPDIIRKHTVHEGDSTKSLIYPTDRSSDLAQPDIRKHTIHEGDSTKSLIYPTTVHSTAGAVGIKEIRTEGKEAKNLLYPTKSDNSSTTKLKLGPAEGHETKELLYPTSNNTEETDKSPQVHPFSSVINLVPDILLRKESTAQKSSVLIKPERSQKASDAKHLLYPDDNNVLNTSDSLVPDSINKTTNNRTDFAAKKKHLKTAFFAETRKTESRTETSQALDKEKNKVNNLKSTAEEGPTEDRGNANPHISETNLDTVDRGPVFDPHPSTAQELLYPSALSLSTNHDEPMRKKRDFEPATRIKEMMYPVRVEAKKKDYKMQELTDVNIEYNVDAFQDDYSVMDLDPQPFLFGDVNKSLSQQIYTADQSNDEKDADVINQLPLETIIKRSLTVPIQSQITLVNKAIVDYFLIDLKIETHFDAFKKFLLLEDGEFGHSLCMQLFEKVSSGMKAQEFCNPMCLNNMVLEALRMSLYASRIDYSNQLKFSVKQVPDVFRASDVAVLDFLELRYRVPWPCNIIVTENSITKYNKVFSFLLRLKKANWSLQAILLNLKKAGTTKSAALSPQLRQIQLFRHEMQHFVNNLERYIVNQILHVSWKEFQQDLANKVNSLDDLHRCHVTYLNKILFRSLLSKNATPVYKLINDIFGLILKFESRLFAEAWVEVGGHVTHPLFGKLKSAHGAFKQCTEFLFSVISKLVRRGYQDHLDDLLLQVNFNTYYTTAVVAKQP